MQRSGIEAFFRPATVTLDSALLHRGYLLRMSNMPASHDPASIVQRQLDAYNARDLDALMATYAEDVEHFEFPSTLVAKGTADVRARLSIRLQEPDLHARLLGRTVMGNLVIDHEIVTRNFPEGLGTLEMLCIYEVADGRIQRASFASGAKTLLAPRNA